MKKLLTTSLLTIICLSGFQAMADSSSNANPIFQTSTSFVALEQQLTDSIKQHKMGLVSKASATRGAASIGVTIQENRVFGVFHPKFAIRMLAASVAAGIEAPIRIYLYENDDGTSTITYKKPSAVFAPYDNPALNQMATELDVKFADIVADALQAQ